MRFGRYLCDKLVIIIGYVAFVLAVFCFMRLWQTPGQLEAVFFVLAGIFMVTSLVYDYARRKSFYDRLIIHTEELDKKYLVLDTLDEPDFYEGKLIYDAMYDINKSMTENVNAYRDNVRDFKDFIDMWVHEIKLPIASLMLMCHNDRDAIPGQIHMQVRRLDEYAEQVLYYVRAEHAYEDYHFGETSLKAVVGRAAMGNKDSLLENGILLSVHDTDVCVMTDSKWLEFMICQMMSNSIKYAGDRQDKQIEIWASDGCVLHIRDNGIGIPEKDIPLVFNKSYTGENGKHYAKSTGMGLYIADSLCRQLGHRLSISSKVNEYTQVDITFGRSEIGEFHRDVNITEL